MFDEHKLSDLTELIKKASVLPDFPPDYSPNIIEVFDQQGLLVGMLSGQTVYECQRERNQPIEYMAWYFDGQLALLLAGSNVLINRINSMVLGASILKKLEV
ncbi:MAG: hypothetical protein F6J89_20140 [Symploca sp. SIO1C4]|uniref:Uncharacterized protein n=1 Tax=Symploca sp. SIO1C4 TaxID=2607765 RepID=A0A6B3NH44_9CYAN|nr:hypothetical protein [Symploca sp. SIO1C4]